MYEKRFIPAYAGNAEPQRGQWWTSSVHPRIRGERRGFPGDEPPFTGSSPHTRGTRPRLSVRRPGQRFIPAYAGNAASPQEAGCHQAVHPRIRGERPVSASGTDALIGSSPHTRGTLVRRVSGRFAYRFIPAYAGNALPDRVARYSVTVHPRIRGER